MRRPRLIEIAVLVNLLIGLITAIVVYRIVTVLDRVQVTASPPPAPVDPGAPIPTGPTRYSPNGTPLPPGATTGAAPMK